MEKAKFTVPQSVLLNYDAFLQYTCSSILAEDWADAKDCPAAVPHMRDKMLTIMPQKVSAALRNLAQDKVHHATIIRKNALMVEINVRSLSRDPTSQEDIE